MTLEREIKARANQLVLNANGPIPGRQALVQAINEYCQGDYRKAVELAAGLSVSGAFKEARARTHVLPEQPTLFDLPVIISNNTPLGPLFIPMEQATSGQVQQWTDEALRHHSSQAKRFKHIRKTIKALALDPSRNYLEQVRTLGDGSDND